MNIYSRCLVKMFNLLIYSKRVLINMFVPYAIQR